MTRKKALLLTTALVIMYGSCYGLLRWRKCIVMHEYADKVHGYQSTGRVDYVRELGPGYDIRSNWRGRLKNTLNPYFYLLMYPCVAVENQFRGFRMSREEYEAWSDQERRRQAG